MSAISNPNSTCIAFQTYAITTAAAIKKDLAITKDTVVVLKNFDELRNDLTIEKAFVAADVEAFINAAVVPLVQEFSQVTPPPLPLSSLSFRTPDGFVRFE
jgi:D-ribose pyranose/furanose isomerase RbsD